MYEIKDNIIKLLVIVLIFFSINGGSSGFLINHWNHDDIDRVLLNDMEIPHHTENLSICDIDKWVEPAGLIPAGPGLNYFIFLNSDRAQLKEYSGFIWQPPEIG